MSESGASAPRFMSQAQTAEELLKNQTVGLVHLDEFRKRRRDVEELRMREGPGGDSDGALTPRTTSESGSRPGTPVGAAGFRKKKRKVASAKGLLSFGGEDEVDETDNIGATPATSKMRRSATKADINLENATDKGIMHESGAKVVNRKLTSNPNAGLPAPKIMTKSALAAEATERDRLRKEFLEVQERVRADEIAIPFVFYDGSNIPGGMVRVKKGDHIWLFLERCRKVGAEMGVGGDRGDGAGMKTKLDGKKSWARIGVDDLMCVRGGVIIPHHHEFYYFVANKIQDPTQPESMLFNYSGTSVLKSTGEEEPLLRRLKNEKIEGQDDDPSYTKVVDRRWYEKNKHIYPASLWKEYKVGKEFEDLAKGRKDAQGNSFFFS